ncbi:processed acidic surface protein [Bacillus sp. V5-8f]|uniref:processed acidic surface protein n=1 Tax=Bacillus sp. V5-8f TaxID=2053044 RepID=UPI000C773D59|nr:processed acidic surface protein [Bacillus sp. V5-8f]PLT35449.1 processed acidic surface protein [Bacillus sp. V5-8f]
MKKLTGSVLAFILFLSILPVKSFAAQSPTFNDDLEAYLQEISDIRGFEVTKDDIENVLYNLYDEELANFESVKGEEGLTDFLGEVIAADYSNLEDMLSAYEMTMEELEALLVEYGESIEDYIFVDDLAQSVAFYLNPEEEFDEEFDEEFTEDLLVAFQEELGLTEQELTNLEEHLMSLEEELSTPEATAKFEQLAERMMAFEDFETLDDLTPEQVSEILAIYDELFTMMHMKLDFVIVKNGKQTPITLLEVLKMEELFNAKLKINIYDLEGKLLADLLITGEMVDGDTVRDIGQDLGTATKKVENVVKEKTKVKSTKVKSTKVKSTKVKTEKGGKLPKTAGNYAMNALLGLCMIFAGMMLYRTYRRA